MNEIETYESGVPVAEIVKQCKVSAATVYRRLRAAGVDLTRRYGRGPESTNWKGGAPLTTGGYVWRWVGDNHSETLSGMVNLKGYVLEHRATVAEALGRPLGNSETVHHINGDRQDNRLENLQLRSTHHGAGVVRRCCDCGSSNVLEVEL